MPELNGIEAAALLRDSLPTVFSRLTDRELEVLQLLAEGKSMKEIAASLNLSVNTIHTHRQHLMEKPNRHSVAELTMYALKEGLTSLS